MHDFAFKQIRYCGEANVWVGSNLYALARRKFSWTHVIEKHERPHHSAPGGWQYPPYGESTQVFLFGLNPQLH
jgi:hypothetical protein